MTIDTGAELNLLSESALLALRTSLSKPLALQQSDMAVTGPDGHIFQILGSLTLRVRFHKRVPPVRVHFHVLRNYLLPSDGLLGLPTLRQLSIHIFPDAGHIKYRGHECKALSPSRPLLVSETNAPPPMQQHVASSPQAPSPLATTAVASPALCLSQAPTVNVVLDEGSVLPSHSAAMIPVRLTSAPVGADVLILSETIRVRGMRLESGIARVQAAHRTVILVHNLTHGNLTLAKGICLGSALVYPAPVEESMLPQSFITAAVTNPRTSQAFQEFSAAVKPSLNPSDYPEFDSQLLQLLFKHDSAVALPGQPLGCTNLLQHKIELLPDARPVYIPAYRLPRSQRDVAERKVQEMIADGIVEPSTSPWNSPLFLVPKKDGDFRPVVDFRRLNQCTVSQRYPLPVLSDLLQSLGEHNSVFSSLGLMSGFWQVPLAPESRPLTAFSTPSGHFHYVRLPMGLKNSPICFQLLINEVFRGLLGDGVFAYLDDIVVVSKDMASHFDKLTSVFTRLCHAGLKVKLSKCHFLKKRLTFLGHVVDSSGLHTSDDKIVAVKNFPRPKTITELKSFLGLSGYYRPFVPHYARLSAPLLRLLKKDAPFLWGPDQEEAFTSLKSKLTSTPVLAFPDFTKPFLLCTDASGSGLGAALMQNDDRGKKRPIAFASRILNSAESRYSVTDLETLAIIWALRHFRDLIYGYPITVYTDHKAIKDLFNKGRNLTGRLARWLVILEDYKPTIEYVPGRVNVVADALSRAVAAPLLTHPPAQITEDVLMNAQRDDPLWGDVIHALDTGDLSLMPRLPVPANQLHMQQGLLLRHNQVHSPTREATSQIVIPSALIPQVLAQIHDTVESCHPGVDRSVRVALSRYWWPSLRRDVRQYVGKCVSCARHKSYGSYPVPMREYPVPERPWDSVAIDLLKLPRATSGMQYLLVCVDQFSRYTVLAPLHDKSAASVAQALVTHVINPFTTPKTILSDNGAEFRNNLLAELCSLFHIQQTFTVAYHPASNGLVERANRKIIEALRHVTSDFPLNWDKWLTHICASINSSYNASINESPFYVLYGTDKRLPYDVLLEKPQPLYNPEDYVKSQRAVFQRIHQSVRSHLQQTKNREVDRQHKSARPVKFTIGDIVFLINPVRESKLAPKHLGPFRIMEQKGNTFTILDLATHDERRVHASHIRRTPYPPSDLGDAAHDTPSPTLPLLQRSSVRPLSEVFPTTPSVPYFTRSRARSHLSS